MIDIVIIKQPRIIGINAKRDIGKIRIPKIVTAKPKMMGIIRIFSIIYHPLRLKNNVMPFQLEEK